MPNGILKLSGFSFGKIIMENDPHPYSAPEFGRKGASTRGFDMWSIGMVLVEMIYGAAHMQAVAK